MEGLASGVALTARDQSGTRGEAVRGGATRRFPWLRGREGPAHPPSSPARVKPMVVSPVLGRAGLVPGGRAG
jgi:hypothetical protein